MSTSVVSLTTNFFPSAENGFTTTTSGSVASAATTVGLNSVAGYTNGEVVVFVIDPTDAAKKQTFTGVMDTSGSQVTSVVWTAGTNQTHALGATVVDYATATHISMMTKGIRQHANQDGTLISQAVRDALNLDSGSSDGWTPFGYSLTSITALGNRSYTAVVSGVDTTGVTCVGQRLKLPRTVTAPTGSITLNGTTQDATKASPSGVSFTGDHSYHIKIKPTAYQSGYLFHRMTGANTGFAVLFNSTGQIQIQYGNGASLTQIQTYQSVPLNKVSEISIAVSVAAKTAVVLLDKTSVPTYLVAGTATTVVQPAAATALRIGSDGTSYFKGQIAQAALFTTAVASATLIGYQNQTLTGSETSLVSAYKLDQASGLNDLSANANNLTANGSPTYSTTEGFFTNPVTGTSVTAGTTNYGIIMAQSFSTNTTYTIQIPEGETLPTTGGIGTVSYSTQAVPYGFPKQKSKWFLTSLLKTQSSVTSNATWGTFLSNGWVLNIPVGDWTVGYDVELSTVTSTRVAFTLSPDTGTIGKALGAEDTTFSGSIQSATNGAGTFNAFSKRIPQNISAQVSYIIYTIGASTAVVTEGDNALCQLIAENAYL